MHIKNKRGQSTVEYVLLMTAVVAVIIALVTSQNGGLQTQLNSTYNSALGTVGDMSTRLAGSEQASNGAGNATSVVTVNVS